MTRTWRIALLLWPLLGWSERLSLRVYGPTNGLTDHSARMLCSTREGYIWVSSGPDLARFDGHAFRIYSAADGWLGGRPYSMLETASGELLVGGGLGLFRFDPNATAPERRFLRIQLPGPAREMEFLFEDSQRRVWVSSMDGGYLRDASGKWRALSEIHPVEWHNQTKVGQVGEDQSGVWAAAYSGIYCFRNDGSVERYGRADHAAFNETAISMAIGPGGKIYCGAESGVFRLSRPSPGARAVVDRVWRESDGLPAPFVPAVAFWKDALWAATPAGLARIAADGRVSQYRELAGIREPSVEYLTVDRTGALWIGSDGAGLFMAPNRGFTNFGAADGLALAHPDQFLEDPEGNLLAFSKTDGALSINRFNGLDGFGPQPVALPPKMRMPWGWSQIAVRPPTGGWWIGAQRGVLVLRDGATPEVAPGPLEGIRGYVFRLFRDSRNSVWASVAGLAFNHVARWEPGSGRWRGFGTEAAAKTAPGGFDNTVASFAEDQAGNIWMGCLSRGLWRYRADAFEDMHVDDSGGIRALHVDDRGRLWIGTQTAGLIRIDDPGAARPVMQRITRADGLSAESISCLTSGKDGTIYICTGRGVDRLDPATGAVRNYTPADGLITGGLRSAYRDRRGAIWFATPEGASRFIPPRDPPPAQTAVRIQSIRVADRPVPLPSTGLRRAEGIVLSPDDRRMEVEYVAFDPSVRYLHRLAGVNDWSAPTAARSLLFEGLSPGDYRLEVRAVGQMGAATAEPAAVSFRVTPPVWRRWWFLTACGAAIAGLAYALHRYRLRQAIAVERVRLRIAADLHDDIGSSLSQVSMLGELARRSLESGGGGTADLIERMAETSRDAVTAMSDIVWSIHPQKDKLGDLAQRMRRFAADLLSARGIEFDFDAPSSDSLEKVAPEARRDLLLVFKEAIHNASRHSGCTRVKAELAIRNGRLHLRVEDDGRGMAARPGEGSGLATMKARAERLGGELRIEDRQPAGVVVSVQVPY